MFKIDQIMRYLIVVSYDSCLMIWLASDWSKAEQKIIIKQNLIIWDNLIVLKF
jgi:hypothetical protein